MTQQSEKSKTICPLCGKGNECGMAAGKADCWCFDKKISGTVLEKIPQDAKFEVCICEECAANGKS